jgi:hypothetical protein
MKAAEAWLKDQSVIDDLRNHPEFILRMVPGGWELVTVKTTLHADSLQGIFDQMKPVKAKAKPKVEITQPADVE